MTDSIELNEEELDIVGDIDETEEPSDVTIYCKGICQDLMLLYMWRLRFSPSWTLTVPRSRVRQGRWPANFDSQSDWRCRRGGCCLYGQTVCVHAR